MKTKIKLFYLILAGFFSATSQPLQWARSYSGPASNCSDISVAASGNVYAIGAFSATTDFDPGAGTFNLTAAGSADAFLSQLDASGNFISALSWGGVGASISPEALTFDGSGNIYVSGVFTGVSDFDPGAGTFTLSATGTSQDVFVMKLDPSGNFIWARSFGGSSFDTNQGVAVDASNNIYTAGNFSLTADFDPGPSSYTLAYTTGKIYVHKLDAAGNFVWVKNFSGNNGTCNGGIGVDGSGNIYTAGCFYNTADFDPGAATFNLTSSAGGSDIYVSKLNPSGNFVWAKQMGQAFVDDAAHGIAVDATGNVYTTGWFQSTGDFDPGSGTYNLTSAGSWDIFISKLDASGNFVLARSIGGTGTDDGWDIDFDAAGNIYTGGYFSSTVDFDPGAGTYTIANASSVYDGFVSKLNATGNFVMAAAFGSTSYDYCYAIAADAVGNLHAGGTFIGTVDFDPGTSVFNLSSQQATVNNGYVVKLNGGALGIGEELMDFKLLSVYPNPSDGEFKLNLKEAMKGILTVTDVMGKDIMNKELSMVKEIEIKLETKGMYFVHLESEGKRITKKVVVE